MKAIKKPGEPGTYTGQIIEKLELSLDGGSTLYLRLSMGDYAIRSAGGRRL